MDYMSVSYAIVAQHPAHHTGGIQISILDQWVCVRVMWMSSSSTSLSLDSRFSRRDDWGKIKRSGWYIQTLSLSCDYELHKGMPKEAKPWSFHCPHQEYASQTTNIYMFINEKYYSQLCPLAQSPSLIHNHYNNQWRCLHYYSLHTNPHSTCYHIS